VNTFDLKLRAVESADIPFLRALFATTQTIEVMVAGWSAKQKQHFLALQFDAQHHFYVSNYPGAQLDIIELSGKAIGRLYVHRRDAEIRLMDIALLPTFRN
jgi:hypothetical protein